VIYISVTLVEIKNIKKYFKTQNGYLHAVDGVDLSIKKGQTMGIVGESGCGKTTLGRVILRLIEPTEGEVLFEGENIFKYNKNEMFKVRRNMQIIFQDPYASLNPRMTVYEIISEPLIVNKLFDNKAELNDKVLGLMKTVGLTERVVEVYPHELDGGRRQRIGIARALALSPKFIVCDEPVSALDVSMQATILNLMMDLQEEMGLTYIFITHDLSVVKHISNEVAVMYLGEIVERATCEELFKNPLHPYTKALLNSVPVADIDFKYKKREIIKGEITSPINLKPGCRFAARCPMFKAECANGEIALRECGNNHFVACKLYE